MGSRSSLLFRSNVGACGRLRDSVDLTTFGDKLKCLVTGIGGTEEEVRGLFKGGPRSFDSSSKSPLSVCITGVMGELNGRLRSSLVSFWRPFIGGERDGEDISSAQGVLLRNATGSTIHRNLHEAPTFHSGSPSTQSRPPSTSCTWPNYFYSLRLEYSLTYY